MKQVKILKATILKDAVQKIGTVINVDDHIAKGLVAREIAEITGDILEAETTTLPEPDNADLTVLNEEKPEEAEPEEEEETEPAYDRDAVIKEQKAVYMGHKLDELKEFAEGVGINIDLYRTKAEFATALAEYDADEVDAEG